MMDIQATARLSQTFAKQAQIPEREIRDASMFLTTLENGETSLNVIETGREILKRLEDKMEVYAFSAAVLAGQESADDRVLGKKLDDIGNGIERVEKTASHLKNALASFSKS